MAVKPTKRKRHIERINFLVSQRVNFVAFFKGWLLCTHFTYTATALLLKNSTPDNRETRRLKRIANQNVAEKKQQIISKLFFSKRQSNQMSN